MLGDDDMDARSTSDALADVFDEDEAPPEAPAFELPPGVPPGLAAAISAKLGAGTATVVDVDAAGDGDGTADDDDDDESPPEAEKGWAELLGLDNADEKKQWRQLPRMVTLASRLVWAAAGRRRTVLAIVLQAISGLGVGAQLLAGNDLLSSALALRAEGGELSGLLPQALTVVGVASFLTLLRAVASEQQTIVTELVGNHAYGEVTRAAAAVELSAFEDSAFYDKLQRAAAGAAFRPWQVVSGLLDLLTAVLATVGIALALAALSPILLPFAFLAAVPLWIATFRSARKRFMVMADNTPDERERSYLRQVLTEREAAKEVRAFNLVEPLRRRHDMVAARILERIAANARKEIRRTVGGQAGSGLAAAVGGLALMWLLVSGRVPVAAAVTAGLAMQQLRGRISGISFSASMVYESALYLQDYADFMAIKPAVRDRVGLEVQPFRRLAAEHVDFAYPGGKRALQDVEVEVRAGEVVALVGENGSGKTTLAKLLCGLYRPTSGTVSWDGVDLETLDEAAYREHITVIFQDFVRYSLSARENVGLGRHQRLDDEEAIAEAVRLAGLDKIFAKLPEGWDTVLGRQFRGGQDLSGGQWQRVALARAFFRDASFLVLDEPTAALDARAEHRLFERLRQLAAGRSVLLITHRFANVRMADRIYVLHKGRVTEHGSHAELMALGGRYAELFNLQASQFLDDAVAAG